MEVDGGVVVVVVSYVVNDSTVVSVPSLAVTVVVLDLLVDSRTLKGIARGCAAPPRALGTLAMMVVGLSVGSKDSVLLVSKRS